MAHTHIAALTITRRAAGSIAAHHFVDVHGQQAAADAKAVGVALTDALPGDDVAVLAIGQITMTAGAAITAGDAVVSDASGLPVPQGSASNVIGMALDAANPGEPVTILIR